MLLSAISVVLSAREMLPRILLTFIESLLFDLAALGTITTAFALFPGEGGEIPEASRFCKAAYASIAA